MPAVLPITKLSVIVAKALLARQMPPATVSESVVEAPVHNELAPVITPATAEGLIVTTCVVLAVPQLLLIE